MRFFVPARRVTLLVPYRYSARLLSGMRSLFPACWSPASAMRFFCVAPSVKWVAPLETQRISFSNTASRLPPFFNQSSSHLAFRITTSTSEVAAVCSSTQ